MHTLEHKLIARFPTQEKAILAAGKHSFAYLREKKKYRIDKSNREACWLIAILSEEDNFLGYQEIEIPLIQN